MQDRLDIYLRFVNEHHVGVRAYIRSLGAKSEWVDDLAQEAFVIAYQRLDEYDDQKELRYWIYGIVRKLLANKRRSESRRQQIVSGPLTDYLQLLDWTGRQVRRDKQGSIPSNLAPILERLKIVPQHWSQLVSQFGRWFSTAAGTSESLAREATRRRRQWLHGTQRSRQVFA